MRVPRLSALFAVLLMATAGCTDCVKDDTRDYREVMREFVIALANHSRARDPGFIIIPQNCEALLTFDGTGNGTPHAAYLAAINGYEWWETRP